MEERHREILRKARGKLVRDLKVADILHRFPEPIFTEPDEEEIKAERRNRHQQTEMFLDILPRKGPRAYYAFKEALRRPYPHLFDVLEKEEEFDRERTSTAKTTRDLRAELQEKTEENKKLLEERKDLRRQLEQMARITEDLNQERENSARLALANQDLQAKLENEKQLEEKGKTRKTTEDENERRKTRAQGEKLRAIRKILDDDGNELPETRRMDEQQGIAAGGIALPDNANNQQQISPVGQVLHEACSSTAELDNENKISKPSVKENVDKAYQRAKRIKSLFEQVHPDDKFEADSERPREKETMTNLTPRRLPNISEVQCLKEIIRESWILENGIFVPFDDNYSNSDVIKYLQMDASAKPCSTANPCFQIDLGEKYRLIVTHYTFEQQNNGSSDSSLRLEGSNDGRSWTTLNSTVMGNLKEMRRLKATWRVQGIMPGYRYFRAIQRGSTAARIYLSQIWLYGVLLQRSLPDKCPRK